MDSCIFCKIIRGEAPSWKVRETENAYAFLDINPINPYHTLVIPKVHYRDIFDIPKTDLNGVMELVKDITTLYHEKLGLENIQIVNSNGAIAQQEVFHIHYHIVPRHLNDGQSVRWTPKPELRNKFDDLLKALL